MATLLAPAVYFQHISELSPRNISMKTLHFKETEELMLTKEGDEIPDIITVTPSFPDKYENTAEEGSAGRKLSQV